MIGGALSLFASALPDGLEWSMGQVAGTTELEASGTAYSLAAAIQNVTALFPDYSFRFSQSAAGTTVCGIVGAVIVAVVLAAVCFLLKRVKRKASIG